jgi:hypothetical protein
MQTIWVLFGQIINNYDDCNPLQQSTYLVVSEKRNQ